MSNYYHYPFYILVILTTINIFFLCRRLLKTPQIDVSYFAAGIVAHLASDGEAEWTITEPSRAQVLQDLVRALPKCNGYDQITLSTPAFIRSVQSSNIDRYQCSDV